MFPVAVACTVLFLSICGICYVSKAVVTAIKKVLPQEDLQVEEKKVFLLLDGIVHYGITGSTMDDVVLHGFARSEEEAIKKGISIHEKNPSVDAVWGEFLLRGYRYHLKALRNDLPPVYKMSKSY